MRLRKIRLYPGSDPSLSNLRHWMTVEVDRWGDMVFHDVDSYANELWIDINLHNVDFLKSQPKILDGIEQVCFYDFFHVHENGGRFNLDHVQSLAQRFPVTWFTANATATSIDAVNIKKVDYLWNRTKLAMIQGQTGWKHCGDARAYKQLPLNLNRREKKFLSLNRRMSAYRSKLYNYLSTKNNGFLSNVHKGLILKNKYNNVDTVTVPPDSTFFDQSYISIQVESQTSGQQGIFFTEKTYDHLVQGRLVLNFGTSNFYSTLKNQGWKLFQGIDYSFDTITNDEERFQKFIDSLDNLLNLSLLDLHDLFLLNLPAIEHNHKMLYTKPYYYIDQPNV
jgi:hypothetical protein